MCLRPPSIHPPGVRVTLQNSSIRCSIPRRSPGETPDFNFGRFRRGDSGADAPAFPPRTRLARDGGPDAPYYAVMGFGPC